jgi:N-acetyl sugar amidotransferase
MKWCKNCVLPETRPNLIIDIDGVCNACKNHKKKIEVNWDERQEYFRNIVKRARESNSHYDCVIPVSGGKDSTWQVVKCLEFGLTPLAVTWRTPGRTRIGQENLDNLIAIGVDHIDYQVNPKVESKFMLRALEKYGSTAIPMHMALFNIPLTVAYRYQVPLVIWGENSAFEYGSDNEELTGYKLNSAWIARHGVTHGTIAEDWVGNGLTKKNLSAYYGPTDMQINDSKLNAIFLGHFFAWDPEVSLGVAKKYGFKVIPGSARTGLYDYADIDDDFISIHHWLKWYKFGFTRLFDNLSLEIRNGRMNRTDAIDLIVNTGSQMPMEDIEKFCNFVGITTGKFFEVCEKFRNKNIWSYEQGVWQIPNFVIKNWNWNET